ncbi:DUF4240 domain-containing protein, partial [Bacillus sp. JJ722]|uniref:DUF4240 domain-containing protein n=1 Tax=Bacillus sp. JJ722 TaxID=3122973 RepID=UPI002FFE57D5
MKSKNPKIDRGDIYAVQLQKGKWGAGKWGAYKVLRKDYGSFLLMLTDYYDDKIPTLNDPEIYEFFKDPAFQDPDNIDPTIAVDEVDTYLLWVDGYPSENFKKIGTVALTKEEEEMECSLFGGPWKYSIPITPVIREMQLNGIGTLDEIFDLLNESDTESKTESYPMMEELQFWSFIDLLQGKRNKPIKKNVNSVIKKLREEPLDKIYSFAETLSHKLFLLDTPTHAQQLQNNEQYFSPDAFLYARCAVVASGQATFENILQNPHLLDLNMDFEDLLTIASKAYERKMDDFFYYVTNMIMKH